MSLLIPEIEDRRIIHDVIYNELCLGEILPASKHEYLRIIEWLAERGAQGIILGCTEISLLVKAEDSAWPLFDTTRIHAKAAVAFALSTETASQIQ